MPRTKFPADKVDGCISRAWVMRWHILPLIPSLSVRVGQMRERRDLEVGHNTKSYMPGFQIPPDKADGLLWRSGVMRQPLIPTQ